MAEIQEAAPHSVREAVVDLFWENRHWPGTTHGEYSRLWDWRYQALADGEPRVWVARDGASVVGHIAVFPRRFRLGDVALQGAVSGDLLVRRDRRPTLLGLQLLKIPQRLVSEGALDFVYTLPNAISHRLALGLGWHDLGAIQEHVDLRRARPLLRRRTSSELLASAVGPLVERTWAAHRWVRQRSIHAAVRHLRIEVDPVEEPSETDRSHWLHRRDRIVGADSTGYIVRRFLRDPFNRRKFFALRDPRDHRLEGYVIVEFRKNRAVVCDCQVNTGALDEAAAITLVARHLPPDVEVLSVPTLAETRLSADLRRRGFVRRSSRRPSDEGRRLTVFWSPQHPQAPKLARAEMWNVYTGVADA